MGQCFASAFYFALSSGSIKAQTRGFADMRVDADGFVWLHGRTEDGLASHWEVFSPTGLTRWKVDAPTHRTILDVADRFVVLLHSGEYGEDLVSVYALERTPH